MIIVFPMAGTGERFKSEGYSTPKPFIKVGGECMISRVISCYPSKLDKEVSYVFLPRQEYAKDIWELTSKIPKENKCVVPIAKETRGPLETILSNSTVASMINTNREILIADCDSLIAPSELADALRVFRSQGAIGGVTIRKTKDPGCSYAMVNTADYTVSKTVEKEVISEWSTTGPYWWRDARQFFTAAKAGVDAGECHISPAYNYLIERQKKVKAFRVMTFRHLGTPKLLEAYAHDCGITIEK